MRRMDLSDYTIPLRVAGEALEGINKARISEGKPPVEEGEFVDFPYEVKDAMIEILLSSDLQLTGRELLERDDIARKIKDCVDGHILLEEEEWNKVVQAVETVKGFGRPDVELVRRVLNAEQIEVEVKGEK